MDIGGKRGLYLGQRCDDLFGNFARIGLWLLEYRKDNCGTRRLSTFPRL